MRWGQTPNEGKSQETYLPRFQYKRKFTKKKEQMVDAFVSSRIYYNF